jgi:hypothetical protein
MALTSLIPADPDAPQVSQMQGGLPQLGTPLMPLVGLNQRGQQEQGLQNRISSYENPNKPQGFWQNVRHIAATIGNVAGDVVAPSTMALIPGTQLHNQIQHGQNVRELAGLQGEDRDDETQARAAAAAPGENALRTAQTANLTSETNARDNPTPVEPSLAQAYAHAVQSAIKNGQDPDKDPIVQHMRDAITDLNKQPAAKGTEHINVMGPDGKTPMIANYNPETGVTTDSTGKPIANPQPYEKPQVTNVNAGTWSLQNDTNGNPLLFNSKTGQTQGAPSNLARKPNAEEQKRSDLAENVNENLNQLEEIANRRPDLFGKVAGRMTKLKETVGTDDPDVATLKTLEDNLGMAMQSAHGMRSAQHVATSAQSVLNGFKNSPEALKAAINAARASVGTFQHDVQNTNQAGKPVGGASPQMIRAIDDKGVLHEAPAGTALPKGWKAQ